MVPHRFQAPAGYQGKTVWLGFDGINFRANVWLNGRQIASRRQNRGRLAAVRVRRDRRGEARRHQFAGHRGLPALPHDLAITFVDWNPQPPDKNMGLWRDVYITATGPVAVRFPTVATRSTSPATDLAQLTVKRGVEKRCRCRRWRAY